MKLLDNISKDYMELNIDDGIKGILGGYIKNLKLQLRDVIIAVETNDNEKLQFLAHKIGGTAGSYGLDIVSKIFKNIDSFRRDYQNDKLIQLLMELDEYLDQVLEEVSSKQLH